MTLRVGVIGVGSMGRNHARVYSEIQDVELVGVADANEMIAESIAKRFGGEPYTDYEKMLDEQTPDAVSIAVPTVEHLEVALKVIKREIHLLIEKPIASSVEEGEKMIASADAAKVQLMVGHIERFNPAISALKELLDTGELGRVFELDARRQGPFPARIRDVGVVIDLAVHDVDVIRYVSASDVVRVYAETERQIHSTYEDLLSGLLRLENGAVGTLTVNWLTPTKIRELYVTGEQGMYRVDYLTQDLYFYENAKAQGHEWDALQMLRGVSEGRMIKYMINKKEPLRAELEAFVGAVRGEASVPVTGRDGLRALEIAQAIVTSGLENRVIAL